MCTIWQPIWNSYIRRSLEQTEFGDWSEKKILQMCLQQKLAAKNVCRISEKGKKMIRKLSSKLRFQGE
jgi:hypothetical protein